MTQTFNGINIRMALSLGKYLFNAEDVAKAVGYRKVSAIDYHIGTMGYLYFDGQKHLDLKRINKLAKKATRTPMTRQLAQWAKSIQDKKLDAEQSAAALPKKATQASSWPFPGDAPKVVAKPMKSESLHGIKEVAAKVGMGVQEFSDWLVAEGYASRYASNNALKWNDWFKNQGYGARPVIIDHKGTRESNIAKITQAGLEFVENRLLSKRESGVLAFAAKASNERTKLEEEIDRLIKEQFNKNKLTSVYGGLLNASPEYRMTEELLLKNVKAVIAQVKLKGK